ncbi:hypothetical protein [Flavobacterium sp.]|uniref:hypothetical protein n=1 Tax=Flavobacterium sp. TaxID=239 RepID=UPI0037BF7790
MNTSCNGSAGNNSKVDCFTTDNFDSVYSFIKRELATSESEFYIVEKTEIHITNDQEITFKSNGYTFSKVNREKGIISLPKYKADNNQAQLKSSQLFCKILSEVSN